jgi:hypothetical protein
LSGVINLPRSNNFCKTQNHFRLPPTTSFEIIFFFFLTDFLERQDLSYPPIVESINPLGPAADYLAPGDRVHQVDGISTIGLTNQHVYSILCHGEGPAVIEIEYSLPEYSKRTRK